MGDYFERGQYVILICFLGTPCVISFKITLVEECNILWYAAF